MKKRILSLVLVVSLLCFCMVSVQATEDHVGRITISEYDLYQKTARKSISQLQREGFSISEISSLKNGTFEQLLLERAQLSERDLQICGYTNEQIRLLKEYDGSPITPNSSILRAISNMTLSVSTSGYSNRAATLVCTWQWSSRPLFNWADMIAMIWKASDSEGHRISTDITSSSCMVAYRNTVTGNLALNKSVGTTLNEVNELVSSKFEMTEILSGDNNWGWAKSGTLRVSIVPQGSENFHSISVVGGYGHAKMTGSIGVSASSSGLSISFTPASRVDEQTVTDTFYN